MIAPRPFRRSAASPHAGFTIVELLVATAITLVMVVLLVQVASGVLATWNRTTGTLSSGNQARVALDYLARDLSSAVLRSDGNPWLIATIQGNQTADQDGDSDMSAALWVRAGETPKPVNNPESLLIPTTANRRLEDFRFGQAGVWLRLFAPDLDTNVPPSNDEKQINNLSTVPRAISYQIVRRHEGTLTDGPRRYQLFRSVVSPRETFDAGYNLLAPLYNTPAASPTDGDAANLRQPIASRLLANNVIDFGIRFFARDATTGALVPFFPDASLGTQTYDSTGNPVAVPTPATPARAFVASSDDTDLPATYPAAQTVHAFPETAEVMLRVLSDEGVRLIEAIELGRVTRPPEYATDAAWWWGVATQHSQVFTRRVEIKARSS